jgi:hypothetical protein
MNEPTVSAPSPFQVECAECHRVVAPTVPGGDRPREHLRQDTGEPCDGPRKAFRLPSCNRCGMPARDPKAMETCGSPLFHPQVWTETVNGVDVEVGNAAAAGEICGLKGADYQWTTRRPGVPDNQRGPAHIITTRDGVRGYPLDAVREFAQNRPGPGGRGSGTTVAAAKRT